MKRFNQISLNDFLDIHLWNLCRGENHERHRSALSMPTLFYSTCQPRHVAPPPQNAFASIRAPRAYAFTV